MTQLRSEQEPFAGLANVSHETIERLRLYADLLRVWNPSAGLVAKSTLPELWTRHFLDSAQLLKAAPNSEVRWIDLGTGGGLPGLVLAILCIEHRPSDEFVLVESNSRKCEFLKTVCRETGVRVKILHDRAERLEPQAADVATARALSSLSQLLFFASRHLVEGGMALFLKGSGRQSEIEEAKRKWTFSLTEMPSVTSNTGAVLKVIDIRRI